MMNRINEITTVIICYFLALFISLKSRQDRNLRIVVAQSIPESIAPEIPTNVTSCPTNFNPLILVFGLRNGSLNLSGVCANP
jgi:hypothetical protein